jgi:TfoX/Sxy family transcriptional regulator of competence genes
VQVPKPSDDDKGLFLSILPDAPDVEVRPMFGNLGAFVNRNMFAGLFGPVIGVRLSAADSTELRAVDGTGGFGPADRPMSGYVGLPAAWSNAPEPVTEWVGRAYAHVSTLPPKASKPPRTAWPREKGGSSPDAGRTETGE